MEAQDLTIDCSRCRALKGTPCETHDDLGRPIIAHQRSAIDPDNEFSAPRSGSLPWLIALLRKQPDLNLKTGEGTMLLNEIDRLAGELLMAKTTITQLKQGWRYEL